MTSHKGADYVNDHVKKSDHDNNNNDSREAMSEQGWNQGEYQDIEIAIDYRA